MEPRSSLKGEKVSVNPESGSRAVGTSTEFAARFEVQSLLGEGGMGSVFVAQDRGLGRVVALKRLREGLEKDQDAMRRFVLEAQIGAQLEHPNIVPLYSFERSKEGSPAITMQLLEGTSMATYIHTAAEAPKATRTMKGEYSLKERIGTLLGVCEAIHFAHERGVIHRDLKPDNVMLGRYREVYVMDWGLARVSGSPIDMAKERRGNSTETPKLPKDEDHVALGHQATIVSLEGEPGSSTPSTATRQGEVMGTPQYMPPEQALGLIDKIGPAADQYALGVMLQELAALRPARSHTSAMKALTEALQNYLEPPIDLDGAALDPALVAIIAKATEKNPEDRYPTVRAMTDDVRRFIRDEPVSVYEEGAARRIVRAAARRPTLAMGIFSGFVVLASAAIIGSVVRNAQHSAQHAQERENMRRAIVAVSGSAKNIDVRFSDLATDVEAIAAATIELLDRRTGDFDRSPLSLPPLTPSEFYGGAPVSFEGIVVIWPGMTPTAELPPSAAKLARVERWLRECVVGALPSEDRGGSVAAQNAALVAGRSDLLRAFVGLEDGTFAQFPARGVTADPRKRPWYKMAAEDPELHWTRPVVDATRRTVRISALRGLHSHGAFLGVAGCDLRVSSLAKKLALDIPGFQRAYLVTEKGEIAVSDTLEAEVLKRTTNPDDPVQLPSVDDKALAARIAEKAPSGYVVSEDRLLVFSRLLSPAWTYVAELEKKKYLHD